MGPLLFLRASLLVVVVDFETLDAIYYKEESNATILDHCELFFTNDIESELKDGNNWR